MADTDVIGIVSLLLAAGGAAYLFRARIVAQRAEAEAAVEEAEEAKKLAESAARNGKTIPPALRPASEPPPAPVPAPVATPIPASTSTSASPSAPPPAKAKEAPKVVKATQVSRTDPLVKAPEEARPPKVETPKPSETKPAESKPKVEAPKAPKPAEKKKELPKSDPKVATAPQSSPSAADRGNSRIRSASHIKKQTIVGLPEPANAPSLGPPKSPAVDKLPELLPQLDIPRLDVEEDEDVEPTRVGRVDRQSIRPPVERHVFDAGAETMDFRKSRPLELSVFALAQTDPGKRRKQNEDSYLVRESLGLYVVADGMGGHRGGEFASKCAVDTIAEAFETKKFDAEAHADLPPEASELARAIQMANSAILTEASQKPELKGMGTTLCAARFTDDHRRLFLGHVGDSRCYRIRNGVMTQMTKDHTMADYGIAGPEGSHLSRALGVWPTVPIDVIMATPELNDLYLLCSDGLTKMLTNETIAAQLLHEDDPKMAVQRLVFFANAHGGKDNITVILLRVVEPGWKPPSERGA